MAKMLFPDYLTYFFVWVALISVMYYPFVYVTISNAISLNHGFKMQQRGKKIFLLKYSDVVYTNFQERLLIFSTFQKNFRKNSGI